MPKSNWWREKVVGPARDNAVLELVLAAGAGVLAGLKVFQQEEGVSLAVAISWGVLVAAALLVGWTAWLQLRERQLKKRLDKLAEEKRLALISPVGIEKQLWEWARIHGLTVTAEMPDSDEDFRLRIQSERASTVTVVKLAGLSAIRYIGGANFKPEHQVKLAPVAHLFRLDLEKELLQLGVEYKFTLGKDGQIEKVFVLHTTVFGENTDVLAFFFNLLLTDRGVKLVFSVARRALAGLEKSVVNPLAAGSEAPPSIEDAS